MRKLTVKQNQKNGPQQMMSTEYKPYRRNKISPITPQSNPYEKIMKKPPLPKAKREHPNEQNKDSVGGLLAGNNNASDSVSQVIVRAESLERAKENTTAQENKKLKKEVEQLKREKKKMAKDLSDARSVIAKLRAEIAQSTKSKPTHAPAREEEKIMRNYENLAELGQQLNVDYDNPDELKSLQVALQMQMEERKRDNENLMAMMNMNSYDPEFDTAERAQLNAINPDHMTYEELLALEEKMGSVSKGLPQRDIKRMQTKTYKAQHDEKQKSCPICVSDFGDEEKTKKLFPCLHLYHSNCIDTWLESNKVCPICKSQISIK